MATVKTLTCENCGHAIRGINAAKGDGWLLDDYDSKGIVFCCCVCRAEYNKKQGKKK